MSSQVAPRARVEVRDGVHEGGGRADELNLYRSREQGLPRPNVMLACVLLLRLFVFKL